MPKALSMDWKRGGRTLLLSAILPLGVALAETPVAPPSFADDVSFLSEHTETIVLTDGRAAVALAPAYQGRVMTSTFEREKGPSLGWLNRPVIEKGLLAPEDRAGKLEDHLYVFGGEERFWIGPEGGQFGIFFPPGAKFEFADWHTPAAIDTDAYTVAEHDEREVTFRHKATLTNWTGTDFEIEIKRSIELLDRVAMGAQLGAELPAEVQAVAYRSDNRLINAGDAAWTREGGLLSIWLLGMYPPTPGTTVAIPFKPGNEKSLGPKVNDAYFGPIPADYLKVENDRLFFRGDGTRRGKLGITPQRSKGVAGSYQEEGKILNLVFFSEPKTPQPYVNSMWEQQAKPFEGDVINSYNDGSPGPGLPPLGPFYEIETSSPAGELKPGEALRHTQTTIHLSGPIEALDAIAKSSLGASLVEIEKAFP